MGKRERQASAKKAAAARWGKDGEPRDGEQGSIPPAELRRELEASGYLEPRDGSAAGAPAAPGELAPGQFVEEGSEPEAYTRARPQPVEPAEAARVRELERTAGVLDQEEPPPQCPACYERSGVSAEGACLGCGAHVLDPPETAGADGAAAAAGLVALGRLADDGKPFEPDEL